MDTRITDSAGNGYGAKVDNRLRLHVDSVGRTQSQEAALLGDAYNISTGSQTLTTDGASAMLYIENNGEFPLVIKEIGIRLGSSTGGSGSALLSIFAQNTGGTIISNAAAPTTNFNRNLGSAKTITGNVYRGQEGYTLTGGTSAGVTATSSFVDAIIFDAEIFVLPKGTNIGVQITPPTGNTSQTAVVFATCFYERADLSAENS